MARLALAILGLLAPAGAGAGVAFPNRDLNGTWDIASLTEMERSEDFKTLVISTNEASAYEAKHRNRPPEVPASEDPVGGIESEWWELDIGLARIRGQVRTSWIVAPADGQRPLTAQAKAFDKARRARRKIDFDSVESRGRGERCLEAGAAPPFFNGGANDLFKIVAAGDRVAIFSEWMSDVRVVRIGGAPLPKQIRVVGGDSVGRWEGATLVVETTNFTPADIDAPSPATGQDMRVIERFTRISPSELHYDVVVRNPARDAQSWRAEIVLNRSKKPLFEYACHEGNYGLENILAGARETEKRAAAGTAADGP